VTGEWENPELAERQPPPDLDTQWEATLRLRDQMARTVRVLERIVDKLAEVVEATKADRLTVAEHGERLDGLEGRERARSLAGIRIEGRE
jgi:hypothetical protein